MPGMFSLRMLVLIVIEGEQRKNSGRLDVHDIGLSMEYIYVYYICRTQYRNHRTTVSDPEGTNVLYIARRKRGVT